MVFDLPKVGFELTDGNEGTNDFVSWPYLENDHSQKKRRTLAGLPPPLVRPR
jgi:hypothetical protein